MNKKKKRERENLLGGGLVGTIDARKQSRWLSLGTRGMVEAVTMELREVEPQRVVSGG